MNKYNYIYKKGLWIIASKADPALIELVCRIITSSYDISLLLLHKKGTGNFKKVNIQGLSPTFGVEIARKI